MTRWMLSVLCGIGAIASSVGCAEAIPPPGRTDSRVRDVMYDAAQVYRVRGFVGRQVHFVLEEGEEYEALAGGDLPGLTVDASSRHVFIKPAVPQVDTNLTILTSRRAYEIDYSASMYSPDRDAADLIYVVRFTYPPSPAVVEDHRRTVEQALAKSSEQVENDNYWYCGSPELRPTAAWDDGARTWLTFAVNTELPAIFALAEDASESLVNFSVHDGRIVIHRVAKRLILRRGKLTGCILNESFAGGSAGRPTQTVSDEVERTVVGAPR
jgi:type IV secretion system protein VirB9